MKWFSFPVLFALLILFVSCSPDVPSHEHTYAEEWTSDETNHWHWANCAHKTEMSDFAPHRTYLRWESDSKKHWKVCIDCGRKILESAHTVDDDGICTICNAKVVYNIGEAGPAGGIIFYINPNATTESWTYLEVATSDITLLAARLFPFGRDAESTNNALGVSDLVGEGKDNTQLIIQKFGDMAYTGIGSKTSYYATRICDDCVIGSKDDWFLPSVGEMRELYTNAVVPGFVTFNNGLYWSSSETAENRIKCFDFASGSEGAEDKTSALKIRPIRMF